jgi:hypothetical protein|tara:strand:+ start:344 stop:874 length:531 start_codon:yes stop_codon:yes gene_type:complete
MLKITDNYFNEHVQDHLEKKLSTNEFPWFYIPETVSGDLEDLKKLIKNTRHTHAFKHFVYDAVGTNSSMYESLDRVFNFKNPIRVKINMLTRIPNYNKDCHNQPHVDMDEEHNTKIYYVNDSDGDTFFFDKDYNIVDRVSPKKGRLVEFKGDVIHAGSNPIKNERRMVININESWS